MNNPPLFCLFLAATPFLYRAVEDEQKAALRRAAPERAARYADVASTCGNRDVNQSLSSSGGKGLLK